MSATVVSVALIREEDKKQLPIYYVIQAFQGAEFGYPKIEKIAFALVMAYGKRRAGSSAESGKILPGCVIFGPLAGGIFWLLTSCWAWR